jgi:hypothetical protein
MLGVIAGEEGEEAVGRRKGRRGGRREEPAEVQVQGRVGQ